MGGIWLRVPPLLFFTVHLPYQQIAAGAQALTKRVAGIFYCRVQVA